MDKINGMAGGGAKGEKNGWPRQGCRLHAGKVPWTGRPEQRERRRAGQGRGHLGLYPRQVQGVDGQGVLCRGQGQEVWCLSLRPLDWMISYYETCMNLVCETSLMTLAMPRSTRGCQLDTKVMPID